MDLLKMYSLLKMGIFFCYVSLPEGRCIHSQVNHTYHSSLWCLIKVAMVYYCWWKKILHRLGCPKCWSYTSIKTFGGIASGAGFCSHQPYGYWRVEQFCYWFFMWYAYHDIWYGLINSLKVISKSKAIKRIIPWNCWWNISLLTEWSFQNDHWILGSKKDSQEIIY